MVEEEDQFTHTVPLIDEEKKLEGEEKLNVFNFDPQFEENENKYQDIKKNLLGDDSDSDGSDDKGTFHKLSNELQCLSKKNN